jgi:hypothetical protein
VILLLSLCSGCADKIEYNFSGEVCEQGAITEMNKVSVQAVFPQGQVGSILISKACYESRVERVKVESIQRLNK